MVDVIGGIGGICSIGSIGGITESHFPGLRK